MANPLTYDTITAETELLIVQYRDAYALERSPTERLCIKSYAFGAYQAWMRITFCDRKKEDEQRLQKLIEFH